MPRLTDETADPICDRQSHSGGHDRRQGTTVKTQFPPLQSQVSPKTAFLHGPEATRLPGDTDA